MFSCRHSQEALKVVWLCQGRLLFGSSCAMLLILLLML